ncbi:ribosomal protection-like ABC-F family protein [Metabacillus hrfriensis]|uniref:ABC-F type ribosomal protection protein n=1 Tax=Metabacillus hrfriensis TaxID=3048891 RepID=A0ACD4RGN7_9BACI|nr:ABC-F type ribosomal protection protein [Metabacillus sp. CT-WN-B3]WHZ59335.1 ABC-F type ribosomal protection protein [Metabacillus sp. CT-WN-B3]
MTICSVHQLAKSYGSQLIFENLSFEINENEKIGFVGRNGTGKTTLFKCLSGIEHPDAGTISIRKGMKVGYLAQIPLFPAGTTVEEVLRQAFAELNLLSNELAQLEMEMSETEDPDKLEKTIARYGICQETYENQGGYEMDAKISAVANGLQLQPLLKSDFDKISGGEKTKVSLGLMLLQAPQILLLDEPTNHLDIAAVEWLEGFLKEYKGTVVVISHDRAFLDEVAAKIIDLEDGEVTVYHHNYSGFISEKQKRLMAEFQAYQDQQKKVKKMREAIKRLREWANQANPPNEGLHKRARNMERALERMEKLKKPILNHRKMDLHFEGSDRSGKKVLTFEKVTKTFGRRLVFENVSMQLSYKDRAAIVGENGSGKSTLLKLVMGEHEPDDAGVRIGSSVKIGYLSQQLILTDAEVSIIDYFREDLSISEDDARHILAKFLFYGSAVFKKMKNTSGGERMRIQLAKLMQKDLNFLILDEPTNHLDIDSREVLEEAIEHFDGTILAVSHDRYFLNKLFTKTFWIYEKRLHSFDGNYSWAREKMKGHLAEKEVPSREVPKLAVKKSNDVLQAPGSAEIERQIEQHENELFRLEEQMLSLTDLAQLMELNRLKEEKEKQIEWLYEQLEAIS